MKTVKFLAVHDGEFMYTRKQVIEEYNECKHKELLNELTTVIVNNDNWMEVKVNKYAIVEKQLPDWCNADYYLQNEIKLTYYFGFGAQQTWSKTYFEKITKLSGVNQFACIKLLNTKAFKSEFRQNLCNQLVAWLNNDENKYETPFSDKQFSCLVDKYLKRDFKTVEDFIYSTSK